LARDTDEGDASIRDDYLDVQVFVPIGLSVRGG
jgi:hypothetical protein